MGWEEELAQLSVSAGTGPSAYEPAMSQREAVSLGCSGTEGGRPKAAGRQLPTRKDPQMR